MSMTNIDIKAIESLPVPSSLLCDANDCESLATYRDESGCSKACSVHIADYPDETWIPIVELNDTVARLMLIDVVRERDAELASAIKMAEALRRELNEARAPVSELIEELAEARAALRHYGPHCIVCDRPATRRYFSSPACDDDKHLAAVRSPAADRLGATAQDTEHAAALRAAADGR